MAEANLRSRANEKPTEAHTAKDNTVAVWGVLLIVLGMVFLLKNFIHFYFLNRMWPLAFIALGAYLVYRSLREREEAAAVRNVPGASEPRN
jgi:uncharacterized membrane protein HdeD (DUF308 family)